MIPRTRRGLVALVVVLGAAGIASACSSTLQNAATVRFAGDDGRTVDIDRDEFEDQLLDVREAQQIIEEAQAEPGSESTDDSDEDSSTVESALAANWLQTRIFAATFEQMFESRGLEVSSEVHDRAVAGTEETYGGAATFEQFPDALQEELIRQQEFIEAIATDEQANAEPTAVPTEEDARAYYEANAASFACASGKQVSHILVADAATAEDLATQLQGGASFAELAAGNSTDTGSARQGGLLGCFEAGTFVPEFEQAVTAAPFDQVVGPVQTEFGYHLILVSPFDASFEAVRDQILQQMQTEAAQQSSTAVNEQLLAELNQTLDDADVTVDPRYGDWQFDDESARWTVAPPKAPTPREQRGPAPTTTTLPELLGG